MLFSMVVEENGKWNIDIDGGIIGSSKAKHWKAAGGHQFPGSQVLPKTSRTSKMQLTPSLAHRSIDFHFARACYER
jgi:hypothetical protein